METAKGILAGVGTFAIIVGIAWLIAKITAAYEEIKDSTGWGLDQKLYRAEMKIKSEVTEDYLEYIKDLNNKIDDLEERISLCEASVEKHIGYLDTVYDVLKWNVKDLDFDRIRYDEEMLKTVDACNTNLHNRITALELMANTTEVHVRVPE